MLLHNSLDHHLGLRRPESSWFYCKLVEYLSWFKFHIDQQQSKMTGKVAQASKKTKVDTTEEDKRKILKEAVDIQYRLQEVEQQKDNELKVITEKYEQLNAPLIAKRTDVTKKIDQFWARVVSTHL